MIDLQTLQMLYSNHLSDVLLPGLVLSLQLSKRPYTHRTAHKQSQVFAHLQIRDSKILV